MQTFRFITKPVCLAVMCLCAAPAPAGIMADLNSLVMSNTTAATTMSTADRTGVMGGSFTMRMPVRNTQWVAFDPPRMSAGCGGVDIYGGSFSFINGQALIQTFRNIASNAAGLFFKAAIQTVSPGLDKLLQEFQSLMQAMNNMNKNSCMMAHSVIDQQLEKDGSIGGANKGLFSDQIAALTSYTANATTYFNQTKSFNAKVGNETYKAIVSSGATDVLVQAGLGNIDGSADDASNPNSLNNRLLISMLGYEIVGLPCDQKNQNDTSVTTSSGSTNNIPRLECRQAATIHLQDLIEGGGSGSINPNKPLRLFFCVDKNGATPTNGGFDPQICTTMKATDFNYQGIKGWVNTNLFGTPEGLSTTSVSILGKYNVGSGASVTLSDSQKQFLQISNQPFVALFSKAYSNSSREQIARKLSQPLVDCIAARMGGAIYHAANSIGNGNSYTISDSVKANVEKLRQDAKDLQKRCDSDEAALKVVQSFVQASQLR
jgi:conjugative transfer pilus assembly protein TraH